MARLQAADLVIDFDAGIVEKDGQSLVLSDLTWRTLCCLAQRQGDVVTIEELIRSVWGDLEVTNETVTQRIKILRRELGDDGQNPRYIGTVRNRGFRFLPTTESAQPTSSATFQKIIMLMVLASLAIGYSIYLRPPAIETSDNSEAELARIVERGFEYLSRIGLEDNQIAISLFEEALRRDGDNHRALVGLSFAVTHNASKFNYPLEQARYGESLARRAIEIDATADAYHALAFTLDAQGRIDEALRYYEMALALEPDNAATLNSVAYLYQVRGQLARALDYGIQAYALDSDIAFGEVQIASTLHLLERDAEASDWLERGLILKPDNIFIHSVRANILFAHGRYDAVLEAIEQAMTIGINRPELLILKGLVAANDDRANDARDAFLSANAVSSSRNSGQPYIIWLDLVSGSDSAVSQARMIIDSVVEDQIAGKISPDSLLSVSGLYAAMHNNTAAFTALNDAIEAGYRDWRTLDRHPMFSIIQSDPRYGVAKGRIRELIAAER